MELIFETKTADYLREVFSSVIAQEESGESIVPDSHPDVGQILQTFGTVVLRGKECRNGSIHLSGGVQAGVVYEPEDHSAPRSLQAYLPFSVRMEHPAITESTEVHAVCRIRHIDAKVIHSRKILVRVSLCGGVTGYEPAQQTFSLSPAEPVDLQLRSAVYPIVRPVEFAQRQFPMAEEIELPEGQAPMKELCRSQVDLELTESRLLGSKAIFKGNALVRLLYLTEDEELATWSCQLPFSQYVELQREYEEQEVQVDLALAELHMEDTSGQGRRLLADLQILAQCTVVGQEQLEVLEDGYSLHHTFTPNWQQVEAAGRLDRQTMQETVRTPVEVPVKSVIDTQVCLSDPTVTWEDGQLVVTLPAVANILYCDPEEEIRGTTARMEISCRTAGAEQCQWHPMARLVGEAFAVPAGEGLEVRCTVEFTVDTVARQTYQTLLGGQLSDERLNTADRPSVILRPMGTGESLWSLAKACCSTPEAIREANDLTDGETVQGMLLIPVMK